MKLLDLFCGAGGAAMGYHRAGFEVVGVDINPQPHYPFEFHQADALTYPLDGFDVIHASPPCQAFSTATPETHRHLHPDLLTPMRVLLRRSGLPYIIENVPGSPIIGSVMLCGSSFGLGVGPYWVRRHRYFETNPALILCPPCQHPKGLVPIDLAGGGGSSDHLRHRKGTAEERRASIGVPWMSRDEVSQAIPPAYTEWIGRQLMAAIERAA
jgi:DNA (cytosine-5)-methyltransferase 1